MKRETHIETGFTLIELLVVIAVIAIVAAMVIPTIRRGEPGGTRVLCMNNLRQISVGALIYADDSADKAPRTPGTTNAPGLNWTGYRNLVKSYVGLEAAPSSKDKIFACPADKFHYDVMTKFAYVPHGLHEEGPEYLSYAFNGGNARTNSNAPGIAGRTLASIKNPTRTAMVMDASALIPYSWHKPKLPLSRENAIFNNAWNVMAFVDGHVSCVAIYWGGNNPPGALALHQEPPEGYHYKWSGD